MIEIVSLSKRFKGQTRDALDQITLTIAPGEVFGLLGPNGAGKTTLLKILATLIAPSAGRVAIAGHDLADEPRAVRRALGVATGTERGFYYRLSAEQNLAFFGALQGLGRDRRARARAALERVQLDPAELRGQPYMALSLGQKKRLDLARALLLDPPVYLLDEPTTAIDPEAAVVIRALIAELRAAGRTILLTSHALGEVDRLADRIGLLRAGKLELVGTPAELKARVIAGRIQLHLVDPASTSPQDVEGLARRIGVEGFSFDPATGVVTLAFDTEQRQTILNATIRALGGDGPPLSHIEVGGASLEDVFLRFAAGELVAAGEAVRD